MASEEEHANVSTRCNSSETCTWHSGGVVQRYPNTVLHLNVITLAQDNGSTKTLWQGGVQEMPLSFGTVRSSSSTSCGDTRPALATDLFCTVAKSTTLLGNCMTK